MLLLWLRLLLLLLVLLKLDAKSDSTDARPRAPARAILAGAALSVSLCVVVEEPGDEVGAELDNRRDEASSEDTIAN